MQKTVCVFCSSSSAVEQVYFDAARELGLLLAERGWPLVYGGTDVGLMGTLARAVHTGKGTVIGIIPESIYGRGLSYSTADETIVTKDLRERKGLMDLRSDAFIALPGGFGTLEEVIEVLTLKQLALHTKPVIFLNTNGFYDPLMTLFEHFYEQKFAKRESAMLYYVADTPADAVSYIENYQPSLAGSKWF
jgi:hypothetical protein